MNISTRISIPRKAKLCHETSSDEKGKNKRRSPSITPSRRISTRSFRDNAITPSPQELRKLSRKAQLQQEPSSEQSLKNRQCSPLINPPKRISTLSLRGDTITPSPQHELILPLPPIAEGKGDASMYSLIQLHHLSQFYQKFFYDSLDFSRVDDVSIYKMIENGSFVAKRVFDNVIPLNYKRSTSDLKDFFNLGAQQQKMKLKQGGRKQIYSYREPTVSNCFGMDIYSVLHGIRTDDNRKLSTIGYESLVRMAMSNRIKSLKENDVDKRSLTHNTDGYLTIESSGKKEKTRYLRRIGSWIHSPDQFSFSVQHICSAIIEQDAVMCKDCKSSLKEMKAKCRQRGHFKANELHAKTNNKVVLMSPTDVETKMKRIQKDLKQVRDKSRL